MGGLKEIFILIFDLNRKLKLTKSKLPVSLFAVVFFNNWLNELRALVLDDLRLYFESGLNYFRRTSQQYVNSVEHMIDSNILYILLKIIIYKEFERYANNTNISNYMLDIVTNLKNKDKCKGVLYLDYFDQQLGKIQFDSMSTRLYEFFLSSLYESFPESVLECLQGADSLYVDKLHNNINFGFSGLHYASLVGLRQLYVRLNERNKSNDFLFGLYKYEIVKGYYFYFRLLRSFSKKLSIPLVSSLDGYINLLYTELLNLSVGTISFRNYISKMQLFLFVVSLVFIMKMRTSFDRRGDCIFLSLYYSLIENQRYLNRSVLKFSRKYLLVKLVEYSNVLPNLYFYILTLFEKYNIGLTKDILKHYFCAPLFALAEYKALSVEGMACILGYGDLIIGLNLKRGLTYSYIVKSTNLDLCSLLSFFYNGSSTDFGSDIELSLFRLVLDKLKSLIFFLDFSMPDMLFLRKNNIFFKKVLVLDVNRVSEGKRLFYEKNNKLELICRAVYLHLLGEFFMKTSHRALFLLTYNLISLDVIFGPVLTIYDIDKRIESNLS